MCLAIVSRCHPVRQCPSNARAMPGACKSRVPAAKYALRAHRLSKFKLWCTPDTRCGTEVWCTPRKYLLSPLERWLITMLHRYIDTQIYRHTRYLGLLRQLTAYQETHAGVWILKLPSQIKLTFSSICNISCSTNAGSACPPRG